MDRSDQTGTRRPPICLECGAPTKQVSVLPHEKCINLDEHIYQCTCGWRMVTAVAGI